MEAQSMVSIVADAILAKLKQELGGYGFIAQVFEDDGDPTKHEYIIDGSIDLKLLAAEAIEAMRNPTDHMVREGADTWERSGQAIEAEWRAMIDAALNEQDKI